MARKMVLISLALVLVGFAVFAQETEIDYSMYFGQFDTDQSGALSQEEFTAGIEQQDVLGAGEDVVLGKEKIKTAFGDTYTSWDANNDGEVADDEMVKGLFTALDADSNGEISMEEWNAGVEKL